VQDRFDAPGGRFGIVVGKIACVHSEGDGLLFARGKKDLAETAQEFYWTIDLGIRKSHIKLDHFFTATRPGVGDFDGYGQIAVGRDFGCA